MSDQTFRLPNGRVFYATPSGTWDVRDAGPEDEGAPDVPWETAATVVGMNDRDRGGSPGRMTASGGGFMVRPPTRPTQNDWNDLPRASGPNLYNSAPTPNQWDTLPRAGGSPSFAPPAPLKPDNDANDALLAGIRDLSQSPNTVTPWRPPSEITQPPPEDWQPGFERIRPDVSLRIEPPLISSRVSSRVPADQPARSGMRVGMGQPTPTPEDPALRALLTRGEVLSGDEARAQEVANAAPGAGGVPGVLAGAGRAVTQAALSGGHNMPGMAGGAAPAGAASMSGMGPHPAIQALLDAHQERNRRQALVSALRAGEMVGGAFTRGAGGSGAVDQQGLAALEGQAQQPMADLAERQQAEMGARQMDQAAGSARALRAIVGSRMPDLPADALNGASADTLLKVLPLLEKRDEASQKRAHDLVMEEIARSRAGASWANASATRDLARSNRLETDVQKAGKDTEGAAGMAADLARLQKLASTEGDIAGVGWADSRMPNFLLSDEGVANQQAALRVASALLRETSGQAVTPSEAARFLKSRGMGDGATEAQFRAGVRELVPEMIARLKAKENKYRPEVMQTLRSRGGFTADQLPGGAAQPHPEDAAAVEWAKQNPEDPRAAKILSLNGG